MSSTPSANWLTQESYNRLSAELENLKTNGRKEIAKRIEEAREEGDLKENGGYHAAKDEQGMMEARIRDLEEKLKNVEVREAPQSKGIVELGTVITANIFGDEETFLLANREFEQGTGDLDVYSGDLDVYSGDSMLGAAILGLKIGEKTSYVAPNGKDIPVEIIAVNTYEG
ncbi:transcription elongation factor GreA [Leucobacter sp. UCMA 4100]|uniref:transcription elongation factor GreA n=1 Tax=Leucobacter sp. UCMA 4100 TaxID=2810534 RepID=UPI0022EB98B7|nr:transcription elongation factor GreA [Leucobacter sp. UCMA 4100]MDA3147688.1 transcription elongation factor GreA [Leucobacter sp. UCMA 4100]